MLNKTEFVIQRLKKSNIKQVERDTGIPANRIYKWLAGKGNPKANDLDLVCNYFQNGTNSESNKNITSDEKDNSKATGINPREGIESLSDMEDINQSASGFKYPYANRPQNGLIQIIQNIESLQMMQNQQIELLKKHVELLTKS